jgi:CubicO group peptidase (beta-lactamase class C family)
MYTLQADDRLKQLADKFYEDPAFWPAILLATNAKAGFIPVKNPQLIRVGQRLWLPPPDEVERLMADYTPPPLQLQPLTDEMLAEFDGYIEQQRRYFGIPGAAVVMVQGNKILFAKGYGVRELGRSEPVTPETIFAVGSTTKAMNSMLLATLVDEGVLDWDQPASEIWPDFTLSDPLVTQQLRLRDLLNMGSGVVRRDLDWSGTGSSAEELMASLADLPVIAPAGEKYYYNNQLVATAGYLGALAAGGVYGNLRPAYIDLMEARIFKPLGMSTATFSLEEVQANPNHATPHDFTLAGEVVPTHFHLDANITPAGGVNANALDMARLVMTQLGRGVSPDGVRVVSEKNLLETWQPQTQVTKDMTYGMGWFIRDYAGVEMIWHDGDVLGFKGQIAFIPEANVGLVVLTNRMLSTGFSYSLRYHWLELLYATETDVDDAFRAQWVEFRDTRAELLTHYEEAVDPAAVAPYLGPYSGRWRVELRAGNTLWAVRGPYEWRLLPKKAASGDYIIANGFGITTELRLFEDAEGVRRMEFTLFSGEKGAYWRID